MNIDRRFFTFNGLSFFLPTWFDRSGREVNIEKLFVQVKRRLRSKGSNVQILTLFFGSNYCKLTQALAKIRQLWSLCG
jgi:hypothetical protein